MILQKRMLSLGMVGVLSFLLSDVLGCILINGYHPVQSYISVLSADHTPYSGIMRTLMLLYQICFLLFVIALALEFFKGYSIFARISSVLLFVIASLSILAFGVFPMTAEYTIHPQNIIHLVLAIVIIALPPAALFLLFLGFRRHSLTFLSRLSGIAALLILCFNGLHLVAMKNGWDILGLVQRLSVYTFHIYTFWLSWIYTKESNVQHRT